MGLRDAAGLTLFEEEKTRLYYMVHVLQDYLHDKKISQASLE